MRFFNRALLSRLSLANVCVYASVGLLLTVTSFAAARPGTLDESRLRSVLAAYLVNFANHIRWPEEALPATATLTIGLLGPHSLDDALQRAVAARPSGSRALQVREASRVEDLKDCQIVFMDQPSEAEASAAAQALEGRPVLFVAFSARVDGSPAAVDLIVVQDGTVRYKLAVSSLRRAGLIPSAGLLQHALGRNRLSQTKGTGSPP